MKHSSWTESGVHNTQNSPKWQESRNAKKLQNSWGNFYNKQTTADLEKTWMDSLLVGRNDLGICGFSPMLGWALQWCKSLRVIYAHVSHPPPQNIHWVIKIWFVICVLIEVDNQFVFLGKSQNWYPNRDGTELQMSQGGAVSWSL